MRLYTLYIARFSWPFLLTYGSVHLPLGPVAPVLLAAEVLPPEAPSFVISISNPEEIPKCESEFLFW